MLPLMFHLKLFIKQVLIFIYSFLLLQKIGSDRKLQTILTFFESVIHTLEKIMGKHDNLLNMKI
jgi:hypothetical protein